VLRPPPVPAVSKEITMNHDKPYTAATTTPTSAAAEKMGEYTDRAAVKAEHAIESTKNAANHALDSLHGKVEDLRNTVPGAVSRAAAQVDELAHKSIERARAASAQVREQMHVAGDRTVNYIRDEPVKAVLIAAATGAVVAMLMSWMRGSDHRHY
jgi:ElaB/YqjD/DUF883 family membrane-anchored ribosome-binding protein